MSQVRNPVERRHHKDLTPSQKVPREEWDFGGVPDEQKADCEFYEYSREKMRLEKQKFPKKFHNYKIEPPYQRSYFSFQKLLKKPGKEDVNCFPGSWDKDDWGAALKETYRPDKPARKNSGRGAKTFRSCYYLEMPTSRNGSLEDVGFRIDWSHADKQLKKEFAAWLEDRRPINLKKQTGKSQIRTAERNLKALGAYRLLEKMSIPQAIKYTIEVKGIALYANEPDWSKAKKLARKLFCGSWKAFLGLTGISRNFRKKMASQPTLDMFPDGFQRVR